MKLLEGIAFPLFCLPPVLSINGDGWHLSSHGVTHNTECKAKTRSVRSWAAGRKKSGWLSSWELTSQWKAVSLFKLACCRTWDFRIVYVFDTVNKGPKFSIKLMSLHLTVRGWTVSSPQLRWNFNLWYLQMQPYLEKKNLCVDVEAKLPCQEPWTNDCCLCKGRFVGMDHTHRKATWRWGKKKVLCGFLLRNAKDQWEIPETRWVQEAFFPEAMDEVQLANISGFDF